MSVWVKGNKTVALVTAAEDKGNYGVIRFTTNRLDKKTDKRVKSFFSFWKVAGTAYEGFDKLVERVKNSPKFDNSDKKKAVMIVIKSFSFQQEQYTDKNTGEIVFSKQPQFTVWDWDFFNAEDKGGKEGMDTAPEVETSPFDEQKEIEADDPFAD
ncbi:MAG: hypothetical protein WA061_02640 [Microgenomates group bacterium]